MQAAKAVVAPKLKTSYGSRVMAVSTWLAIQQPSSLMLGAPGKELAGLTPSCGKISERKYQPPAQPKGHA